MAPGIEYSARIAGRRHPDVAWTLTNLGQTDLLLGNITSATMSLDQSALIYRRAGVSDQPDRFAQSPCFAG